MDWGKLFEEKAAEAEKKRTPLPSPTVADVGCGFGGLLISLSPLLPDDLMVGIELRDSVCDYVRQRAAVLRRAAPPRALNVAALRVNAQRHLTHLFAKGSLAKLFFLFPDPHFKAKNFRRRIVTPALASDYAYLLRPGGCLYTVTDVPDLGGWMAASLDAHPLFRRMTDAELAADPAAALLDSATEEGQKVARNAGSTWKACYVRLGEAREVGGA
jgi:tRNA (guanine-N7-)-methyltransferase